MMTSPGNPEPIARRLRRLRADIGDVCAQSGREPDSVSLLAVCKGHSISAVESAYAGGQRHFAENYWQELKDKIRGISHPDIVWHFIGRLQSRKAREMANHIDWLHSITRAKTAELLHRHRSAELPALNVCVQISLCGEERKDGIALDGLPALLEEISGLDRLRVRGLMTILPERLDAGQALAACGRLKAASEEMAERGYAADTLSMGMSGDWREAVRAGSTLVRLGTAVFGPRPSA